MNSLEYYKGSLVSNNWSLVELELDLNEFDRQLQKMILSVAYIYKVLCYLPPVFDITFPLHLVYKYLCIPHAIARPCAIAIYCSFHILIEYCIALLPPRCQV